MALAALVVAVAVITLFVVGASSHTSRHDATFDAGAPVVAATHATSTNGARTTTVASKLTPTAKRPRLNRAEVDLQTRLAKLLASAGPDTGALVYDLSDHAELFALHPTVARAPASVEKLWTTTAVLERLGPQDQLQTALLGAGSLRHGVWHGDLYLRGGGDPTFGDPLFNKLWNRGYGPTPNQLVAQLQRRGIRRVTGLVYADAALFDRRRGAMITDQRVDIPDLGGQLSALTYDHGTALAHFDPATFAVHELALTMRAERIFAKAAPNERTAPIDAQQLAVVSSPPMSVMTRLMDVPSDDFFAELFAKQLGASFGGGGTIADGARVIAQTIASDFDLHPRILDGSGLDRDDRTSPLEIVDLLRDLSGTATGAELSASLPTVGVNGTVQSLGVKTAAQGHCVAKTGTLDFVTNLAGYCAARGHHQLAFGLFVDGPSNGAALALESKMVAAIAGY